MAALVADELHENGYSFLAEDRSELDTVSLATVHGQPMTPWAGGIVQELVPRENATPNTYSGIYGLKQFPFHTDLAHWRIPPRYLLLRCVEGSVEVSTLLFDGRAFVEGEFLEILSRAICRPRRPIGGSMSLLRLCEPTEHGFRLRWDEVFLKPASRCGEIAHQRVREHLAKSRPHSIALVRAGDTLLIDNWRMFHARSPIPVGARGRKIERIYLESLK